jgi:hypothetical protein
VSDKEFAVWHETLLNKAREIVRVSYVASAIRIVARLLDGEYAVSKKGLPAKDVRIALSFYKERVIKETEGAYCAVLGSDRI